MENVELLCFALCTSQSESGHYKSKLDTTQRFRKTVDGSRRQSNQQKLDAGRDDYHCHLRETVDAQKETY